MAILQDTLWEQFLKPFVGLLINQEEIQQLSRSVDWEKESNRFRQPNFSYPEYYLSQNFHGIEGGYLNLTAALTYDAITKYALPPNENWIRQELIDAIGGKPRRIIDLGCGTGSTTLMLKKAFPKAEVIGIDFSPYMLAIANYKAEKLGLQIQWQQGNTENTNFSDNSFDLVTASLLFHETPPQVSQTILRECFRLLIPGGQVIVLDGNQKTLRHTDWLTNIFEEPYIKAYANESVDAWMGAARFEAVQTEEVWGIHQITKGIKPTQITNYSATNFSTDEVINSKVIPAF